MNKGFREVCKIAESLGWNVHRDVIAHNAHVKLTHPKIPKPVFTSIKEMHRCHSYLGSELKKIMRDAGVEMTDGKKNDRLQPQRTKAYNNPFPYPYPKTTRDMRSARRMRRLTGDCVGSFAPSGMA